MPSCNSQEYQARSNSGVSLIGKAVLKGGDVLQITPGEPRRWPTTVTTIDSVRGSNRCSTWLVFEDLRRIVFQWINCLINKPVVWLITIVYILTFKYRCFKKLSRDECSATWSSESFLRISQIEALPTVGSERKKSRVQGSLLIEARVTPGMILVVEASGNG